MITTRKFKLAVVSENKQEIYDFMRYEMYQQNRALNVAARHLIHDFSALDSIKRNNEMYLEHRSKYKEKASQKYAEYIKLKRENDTNEKHQAKVTKAKKEYDKAKERLNEIEKKYSKEASEVYQKTVGLVKQTRIGKLVKKEFDLHYDTVDRITSRAIADFNTDIKGVLKGERSPRMYKKTNPLMIRHRNLKLYQQDENYFIKWINGALFKIILSEGNKQKVNLLELKHVLDNLINGNYKMRDSSISLDKKLILNFSINIPNNKENYFIPNRIVGVDLGIQTPAYVSLSDDSNIKKAIGNREGFWDVRGRLESQRRNRQKSLSSAKGGKGRKKKLKGLDILKLRERNFVKTYNHYLSASIIKFAIKNHAGVIHLEELKFDKMKNKSLLRKWSYFELQTMVEYKATQEGIKVYFVDAKYTSQTCSKCGNLEKGQRISRDTFKCLKCGYTAGADYNASQNIARSKAYIIKIQNQKTAIKV